MAGWKELPSQVAAVTPRRWACWLLELLVLFGLSWLYWMVVSAGLAEMNDVFATKLSRSKFPLAWLLEELEDTRDVTAGHLGAVALLLLNFWAYRQIVRMFGDERHALTNRDRMVWAAGVVFIGLDLLAFYTGLSGSFLGDGSPFTALALTALYGTLLALTALFLDHCHHD